MIAWLDRTEGWGADFYVMYGQTEATARMAYLPPALARRHPDAIGRAIPGGSLRLEPVAHDAASGDAGDLGDVGELVYRGPNVMLGYATSAADLALGAIVDELRTGDLARFRPGDGVYEIVGRRSRFVKPFGLRIDLDALQRSLATDVHDADEIAVAGDDSGIAVLAPGAQTAAVDAAALAIVGLPPASVAVRTDVPVPRTASGKIDESAVIASARERHDAQTDSTPSTESVAAIYSSVLRRDHIADDDTFVALGGDSLSYIECSIRLEAALGRVPNDWHLTAVSALTPERRHRLARLDTTVVLRAIGICAVVATHMHLWFFPGGAHLLLAVVGFNLSSLPDADRRHGSTAHRRTADGSARRRPDGDMGRDRRHDRGDPGPRYVPPRQQLRRPAVTQRGPLAFLVHRGVRPPRGRHHRVVGDSCRATRR